MEGLLLLMDEQSSSLQSLSDIQPTDCSHSRGAVEGKTNRLILKEQPESSQHALEPSDLYCFILKLKADNKLTHETFSGV